MREKAIDIFSERLDEVLSDVDHLFDKWDRMAREERCPKALASLEQMAELVGDAQDVSKYLQEAYPPVRLTADDDWRKRLEDVSGMIRKAIDQNKFSGDGMLANLLNAISIEERGHKQLTNTMNDVVALERLLMDTLLTTFSHLLELMITLRATLDGDRTEALGLLYAQAEARYSKEEWRKGEESGGWKKFILHMKNTKFPWGEPTCEQLKNYYNELADDFDQTPLGKVFLENEDDPQALGSAIAKVGCSNSDLKSYFREVFRLRELKKMIDGMRSETDIQHLDFEKTIPEEFRTGLLLKAWNELVKAKILTEDYQLGPGVPITAAKFIVEAFCQKRKMPKNTWAPFEQFWGVTNLRTRNDKLNKEHKNIISRIFRNLE